MFAQYVHVYQDLHCLMCNEKLEPKRFRRQFSCADIMIPNIYDPNILWSPIYMIPIYMIPNICIYRREHLLKACSWSDLCMRFIVIGPIQLSEKNKAIRMYSLWKRGGLHKNQCIWYTVNRREIGGCKAERELTFYKYQHWIIRGNPISDMYCVEKHAHMQLRIQTLSVVKS